MFSLLEISVMRKEIQKRIDDLIHTMEGARLELEGLRQLSGAVRDSQLVKLHHAIEDSSVHMHSVFLECQRSAASLHVVQVWDVFKTKDGKRDDVKQASKPCCISLKQLYLLHCSFINNTSVLSSADCIRRTHDL